MNRKNIITASLALLAVICASGILYKANFENKNTDNTVKTIKNSSHMNKNEIQKEQTEQNGSDETNKNADAKNLKQDKNQIKDSHIKRTNLYDEAEFSTLPLSAISIISSLPTNIQNKINKIIETNNVYMIQKNGDKVLVITDNPANIRHSIEFTEISLSNGHQTKTTLGYNDKMQDSNNDIWEYNKETNQPVRHTKYNSDGDMEFVETWNYDNNAIKYEMKDADGDVITLRKETQQGDSDLRVEHLVYDKSGNTKINVSATYDGANLKRFTYYNADKPSESGSIFGEYSDDGFKTQETLYSSDLKVKNIYSSSYQDGTREEIIIKDNQNKEIQKLLQKSSADNL